MREAKDCFLVILCGSSTLYVLFLLLSFAACEQGVVFKEANPPGIVSIDRIPEPFHRVFMCESDSSIIRIREYDVITLSSYNLKTSIESVIESENCALVDGGIHVAGSEECFPFDYISEDSISVDVYLFDTLFAFEEDQLLKYYKNQLFLNIKTLSGHWHTWTLAISDDRSLALSFVSIPSDEGEIENLTDRYETKVLPKDRIQFILHPTIEEFDYILSREYRDLCDILIPIDKENDFPNVTANQLKD